MMPGQGYQGLGGRPEHRLQRAARGLKAATTFVEHIAAEEGVTMPIEVWRAVATIRQWTRQVGAVEPGPPVMPPQPTPEQVGARPRRRDQWRRRMP